MNHFIISPIVAHFNSLKHPDRRSSRLTVMLMLMLYGFFMNTESEGADLYRYLRMLEDANGPLVAIRDFLSLKDTDIYRSLSISIIGLFTKNGHILMAWFGFVLGYIQSRCLRFFKTNSDSDILSWILVVLIIGLTFPGLAGVRQITASWLFFYGLNVYVSDKNGKGLILMLSSILVHFSFMITVAMLLPFYFLKDRTRLCVVIFLASFFFTLPGISSFISNIASHLGGVFESRASTYSLENTEYMDRLLSGNSELNWYIKYRSEVIMYGLAIFGLILTKLRRTVIIGERERRFLNYFFLMFAFRNIVVDVPDLGVRTTGFCITIALYVVFLIDNANRRNRVIRNATFIVVAANFLNVAYAIRTTFDYVSLWELVVSPIISLPIKMLEYL